MRLFPIFLCLLISGCDLIPRSHLERVRHEDVLRVLTRNSATTYYEGSFGPTGLEYELVAGFADYLGVQLQVETPDTLSQILDRIQAGDADLAAAGLTVTDERKQRFNFGDSYQSITPQLVYRVGAPSPRNLDTLNGSLEVVANHQEEAAAAELQNPFQ